MERPIVISQICILVYNIINSPSVSFFSLLLSIFPFSFLIQGLRCVLAFTQNELLKMVGGKKTLQIELQVSITMEKMAGPLILNAKFPFCQKSEGDSQSLCCTDGLPNHRVCFCDVRCYHTQQSLGSTLIHAGPGSTWVKNNIILTCCEVQWSHNC